MIYDNLNTRAELCERLNITNVTIRRLIGKNDHQTANRLSVDKIIQVMNDIADKFEKELNQ